MNIKLKALKEQVIVITGASSGIGLATAETAVERGAKVVLAARSAHTLQEIVQRLNGVGGETKAIAVRADVADRTEAEHVAAEAINQFGRIDTWINNAGVAIYGRLDEVSDADSRRLFETNFWGLVNGSLVALPHLKSHGGALINVGSEVSDASVPLLGMYVASKHAVKGFTDALRIELQELDKSPVSITLIQPTATNTPFPQHAKNYMDEEPKLPNPIIDPYRVAEAILHAAENPEREMKVGAMSKMNTFIAKNAPAMAQKMGGMQAANFKSKMPPVRDRDGALYRPSEDGNVYGYLKEMEKQQAAG